MLSHKIKLLRKDRNWSQELLAEKMNISRQTIWKWESGRGNPSYKNIYLMSKVFGVSSEYWKE